MPELFVLKIVDKEAHLKKSDATFCYILQVNTLRHTASTSYLLVLALLSSVLCGYIALRAITT